MSSIPLQVRLACGELLCPKRLGRFEPGFEMRHWFWSKCVTTHTRVESRMRLLDEAVDLQIPQMRAQCRRVAADGVGDLAGPPRPNA